MTMSQRVRHRAGLSLLELLIAVVVLGIAGAGLGKLMLGAAKAGGIAGAIGYRTAVLHGEIARVTAALPGSIPDGTTLTVVTTLPFPYRLTSTAVTVGRTQTVTITVQPTGARAISAVVRTVQRTLTASPFGGP
jgi:prepilin-type N-terminal cleavage/methylation domain-containing protein